MCLTWLVVHSGNWIPQLQVFFGFGRQQQTRYKHLKRPEGFVEALPASSAPGMCTSVFACSAYVRWSKSTSCALRTTRSRRLGSADLPVSVSRTLPPPASIVGCTLRGSLISF
ncbi:unnamed protein product, partial [Musa textilis]